MVVKGRREGRKGGREGREQTTNISSKGYKLSRGWTILYHPCYVVA